MKQYHVYQPEFIKENGKLRKDRSKERVLATNSIDAYFDIDSLMH